MTKRNTRLVGHELWSEGAAYEQNGPGHAHIRRWASGTGGEGYAVCSCGDTSEVLTSGTARRQWHSDHKQTITNIQHDNEGSI